MLIMCRPIFGSEKVVVLNIELSVAKGITDLEAKGVYVAALINNSCYWPARMNWAAIAASPENLTSRVLAS